MAAFADDIAGVRMGIEEILVQPDSGALDKA